MGLKPLHNWNKLSRHRGSWFHISYSTPFDCLHTRFPAGIFNTFAPVIKKSSKNLKWLLQPKSVIWSCTVLTTCPRCGKEAERDDQFCRFCGAPLKVETKTPVKPAEPAEEEKYREEPEFCFGERERHADYTGLVSFGLFLLIIGVIFVANPSIFSQLNSWANQMSKAQSLLRPPREVINSAVLFFVLVGLSDFFVSGIRFMTHRRKRRAVRNVFSGVALITFSYLVYLYGQRTLVWQIVLALEILVIGLLVIIYGLTRHLLIG
jgi:hypothetical protein